MSSSEEGSFSLILKKHILLLGTLVAVFWLIEIIDFFEGGRLDLYGIRPRSISGLWGIAFAPFLHGGFTHLISNTVPFVVLGMLVLLHGSGTFILVFIITAFLGGLGCWTIGAEHSIHIGASGVIFGFLGFLLLSAWYERSIKAIFTSVVAGGIYGGILFGVLPGQPGVSWEGHLFGFLGGITAARLLKSKQEERRRQRDSLATTHQSTIR